MEKEAAKTKDQEIADSVAEFVETVDLEDIIAESDVYGPDGQKIEPKKEEPQADEADPEKPQPDQKETEPKKADAEKPEEPEKKPEQTVVSKPEGDDLPEEYRLWKKAWENREDWEKKLKQKSQGIAKLQNLTPEQQEIIFAKLMPFVYGEEKIPDTPEELVTEAIGKINDLIPEQLTLQDEDGIDVIVTKEHYEPIVKKAAGEILKRYLPELSSIRSDYQKLNDDYQQAVDQANKLSIMNGEIILDNFGAQYPDSLPTPVNDDERPSQALRRVMESGDDHPEYFKVLRCKAAAELRGEYMKNGKNTTFQEAYDKLYGTEYRKAKQKEQIDKELAEKQKKVQPETPGQAVEKSEADKIVEEVFGGESHEEAVSKYFR